MGHRQLFNPSQILETDNDEERNQSEHEYVHFSSEGSSFVHPPQNTAIDSRNLALQLNHPPNSGGILSCARTSEYPQYQPQLRLQHPPQPPRPTYDPFLHTSTSGSHNLAQENYACSSSSSIHRGQTFHGRTDGAVMDFPGSGRGSYKRKRQGFSGVCQRGSTSRYGDCGSSSSVSMSTHSRQEKQVADAHQPSWDFSSGYGGHGVTFHSEDTPRNVRSRISFDLESNSARTHFSPNPAHNSMVSVPINRTNMSNVWGQAPNMFTMERNHGLVNPTPHGRPFVSDPGVFGPENHIIAENSNHSAAMEIGGYHGDYSFHQNPVPQSVQVNPSQSVRGIRSSYHQRYAPGMRASSSNVHPGTVVAPNEGFPVVSHGYSGRHSRSHPTSVHRDRGRPRASVDRYRALPNDMVIRNHLNPEGLVIIDRSAFSGSRTLFDQHRDMRLDIDNMSYEELLALEERIGTVNTGVSDDMISKCLTESTSCSSNQPQEEGKCVICLEEYKKMDDVGSLKLCGHEFHVQCIRKWLAVKNLCPICKSCALDEKMKNN
ncbi:ubiquitin-protein ligase [Lithospermum erythrorhizon]|uniref:RING-type E3 ubiquitin transferase n=1 Tax=Lithospermum erythrorhizon TaxID=34254 RepID=A0AAV3QMX5_LITER